ncbi:MAG: hypothetical protein M3347_07285 [Armatimonadota bacterium]|nr:hypothetical protein [Armatimonadota bacterium]
MKTWERLLGCGVLIAVLMPIEAGVVHAKAGAPPKSNVAAKRQQRKAQREAQVFTRLESVLGKKLTATQKQQLRQAFEARNAAHRAVETKFRQRVGQILHLSPEQLRAKERQLRALGRGGKGTPKAKP